MFQATVRVTDDKETFYREIDQQLAGLLTGERDFIANAANLSALIFMMVPDLNWSGFYLLRGDDLLLGPFQGKPACVRIPVFPEPRGVCGTAAFQRKAQWVPNVHDFAGHIACDSASNAEVAVPLVMQNKLIGVLDIDSPTVNRFDAIDLAGIEKLAATFLNMTDAPN